MRNDSVWISIDDTYYFSGLDMLGSHDNGSVGIGTEYYKVIFDNIREYNARAQQIARIERINPF